MAKRLEEGEAIPAEVLEAMAQAYEELGYDGEVEDIDSELERRYAEQHNI